MTHWRKGDKSDFLMSWDIEGELKATIVKVARIVTKVRGQEGSFRVAYFDPADGLKPIIINVLNGTTLEQYIGNHQIESWGDIKVPVVLFVDENVKFGKTKTRGLRFRINGGLPLLVLNTPSYVAALKHIKDGGKMADIETRYKIEPDIKIKLEADANT